MTQKKIGGITVNDGNGLFDSDGLCDSLLVDINNLFQDLVNGQFVRFCSRISDMAQKVAVLKNGIKTDSESMQKKIEETKRMCDNLAEQLYKIPVDKEGVDNGAS